MGEALMSRRGFGVRHGFVPAVDPWVLDITNLPSAKSGCMIAVGNVDDLEEDRVTEIFFTTNNDGNMIVKCCTNSKTNDEGAYICRPGYVISDGPSIGCLGLEYGDELFHDDGYEYFIFD